MNTRLDRTRLNIGAYILQPYARTEEHIKGVKECGIDMIIDLDYDIKALDLFYKYGLGAIVRGVAPHWWGGMGKSGQFHKYYPLEMYDRIAAKYNDHPAVWGISIGDEPSALDIPHYGKVLDKINRLFPTAFPYLNLYPNYATVAENTADETVSQLGTKTYAEYIDVYCKHAPIDYISYDYYVYATKNLGGCLENFRIVSEAARKYGKRFMYIPQVNSQNPAEIVTVNQMRYQAFSAMSFGAEDITWGCYTAGWWHHNVLDEKGEKTEQYDKLKLVNSEIRTLAEDYMRYRNTNTHLIGFSSEIAEKAGMKTEESLSNGYFTDLRAGDGRALIIGEMVKRDGNDEKALFITVSDDYLDKNPTETKLTFKSPRSITAYGKDGKVCIDFDGENYSMDIKSCEGYLIIAK